ncbi:MAG: hypothetical protein IPK19_25180 [Chloroflexi bacterium]|nr:hypothetical protein [Chloroflexota bacterium]
MFDIDLTSYNQPVTVEAPAEFTEMPSGQLTNSAARHAIQHLQAKDAVPNHQRAAGAGNRSGKANEGYVKEAAEA